MAVRAPLPGAFTGRTREQTLTLTCGRIEGMRVRLRIQGSRCALRGTWVSRPTRGRGLSRACAWVLRAWVGCRKEWSGLPSERLRWE
ncbi:hypothetical protein BJV77DRAFT_1004255 [Russula vinacea]|nr:hypothetical protein BJV77DRAFT_1004255 [Russula vinacea]